MNMEIHQTDLLIQISKAYLRVGGTHSFKTNLAKSNVLTRVVNIPTNQKTLMNCRVHWFRNVVWPSRSNTELKPNQKTSISPSSPAVAIAGEVNLIECRFI